jgi:hypothetical protein
VLRAASRSVRPHPLASLAALFHRERAKPRRFMITNKRTTDNERLHVACRARAAEGAAAAVKALVGCGGRRAGKRERAGGLQKRELVV